MLAPFMRNALNCQEKDNASLDAVAPLQFTLGNRIDGFQSTGIFALYNTLSIQ
jgi:hypothetical protein